MPNARVFVYGTLKSGFGNHSLLSNATFLGTHNTDRAFKMLNLGSFPALIESTKCGYSIYGEVYEVDQDTLRSLDMLEGYPGFYNRKVITTPYGEAWVYYLVDSDTYGDDVIDSGNWGT